MAGLRWAILGCSKLFRASLGCPGCLSYAGLSCAVLGYPALRWAILGYSWAGPGCAGLFWTKDEEARELFYENPKETVALLGHQGEAT